MIDVVVLDPAHREILVRVMWRKGLRFLELAISGSFPEPTKAVSESTIRAAMGGEAIESLAAEKIAYFIKERAERT